MKKIYGFMTVVLIISGFYLMPLQSHSQNVEYIGGCPCIYAWDVFVDGDYAYISSGDSGVYIINIVNPASPNVVGRYNSTSYGIFVAGSYAYIAAGALGLHIVDITDVSNPILSGVNDTANIGDIFIRGCYAYAAGLILDGEGIIIYDISDPLNPILLGAGPEYISGGYSVYVLDNYAYILGEIPFFPPTFSKGIYDVSNPNNPSLSEVFGFGTNHYVYNIDVSGNYAYMVDDSLLIMDVSSPSTPSLTQSFNLPDIHVGAVFASSNFIYVAAETRGIRIIDVADPLNPLIVGSFDTPDFAHDIYLLGDYIYVADGSSLQILRFTPTVIEESDNLPEKFMLSPNYPNPFNSRTMISFTGKVDEIKIFNLEGRLIKKIPITESQSQVIWDASDDLGKPVSSGIYFARAYGEDISAALKLIYLK